MNEINSRFKIWYNKTNLMLLSVLRSRSSVVMILVFPFLSIVPVLIFFPLWGASPFIVQLNVVVITGLIYGNIIFGYKKSTLDNNEKLVSKSRSSSYLSSLLVIMIFVLLSSMIQVFYLFIANWIGIIMPDWVFTNSTNRGYDLTNIRWFAWAWGVFWISIITFGIFFSLRKIINSRVVHYNITLSVCIISFIWGGSLNDYFPGMVTFDGLHDPEFRLEASLFPAIFYWPTVIIFPFYAPGQIISISSDFSILRNGVEYYPDTFGPIIHLTFNQDYQYTAQWNALIIMPILWTSSLFIIGVIQSKKV